MRFPPGYYQIERRSSGTWGCLRMAQRRGLALGGGAVLAQSACQHAVLAALGLYAQRAAAAAARVDLRRGGQPALCGQAAVRACFAPLLGWVLACGRGVLALALDATLRRDELAVLTVSVLYRGTALPVAWHVLPANRPGARMGPSLRLLRWLRPAVPPGMEVLVLADRGRGAPGCGSACATWPRHPLLRLQGRSRVQPAGQPGWVAPAALVPGPGHAWVGAALAHQGEGRRRSGTLVVWWDHGHAEPVVALTDLPPGRVGACWYGLVPGPSAASAWASASAGSGSAPAAPTPSAPRATGWSSPSPPSTPSPSAPAPRTPPGRRPRRASPHPRPRTPRAAPSAWPAAAHSWLGDQLRLGTLWPRPSGSPPSPGRPPRPTSPSTAALALAASPPIPTPVNPARWGAFDGWLGEGWPR
ncbi:MAG: hypothetical protein U0841_33475 [Chloroflexia bacterium]